MTLDPSLLSKSTSSHVIIFDCDNRFYFIGTSGSYESRFGSLDSAVLKGFQYLRIKKNPFSFTHSNEFSQIIIVPNTEENMNMVLLIPKNEEIIAHQNIHALIRTTLNVSIDHFN